MNFARRYESAMVLPLRFATDGLKKDIMMTGREDRKRIESKTNVKSIHVLLFRYRPAGSTTYETTDIRIKRGDSVRE